MAQMKQEGRNMIPSLQQPIHQQLQHHPQHLQHHSQHLQHLQPPQPQHLQEVAPIVSTTTTNSRKRKQRPDEEENKEKHEKRGWDSWDGREKEAFFNCLREYGRNFDKISSKIETKSYDQVRYFYYRLLKKIDKLLAPQVLDRKDHTQISNALLSFWEINKDTKLESNKDTTQLSLALKERMQSRNSNEFDVNRETLALPREFVHVSKSPKKEHSKEIIKEVPKVEILLSPSDHETSKLLQHAKCPDTLQFVMYVNQTVNDILRLMVQSFHQLPNLTVNHIRLYITEHRPLEQNSGIPGNTSIVTLTSQHHGNQTVEVLWKLSASAATSKILHIFYSLLTLPPPKEEPEQIPKSESLKLSSVLNEKSLPTISEDASADGFGTAKQDEIAWKTYYDQFVSASDDEPISEKSNRKGGQTSFKNLPFLKK